LPQGSWQVALAEESGALRRFPTLTSLNREKLLMRFSLL